MTRPYLVEFEGRVVEYRPDEVLHVSIERPPTAYTDIEIARLLAPCGSCDAGLPQACTCPDLRDLQRVLVQVLSQRDEARAALDRVGAEVRRATSW